MAKDMHLRRGEELGHVGNLINIIASRTIWNRAPLEVISGLDTRNTPGISRTIGLRERVSSGRQDIFTKRSVTLNLKRELTYVLKES